MTVATPLCLLYLYASADEKFRKALEQHLSVLKHERLLEELHQGILLPGANMEQSWQQQLSRTDVVLALVSADFLSCHGCLDMLSRSVQRQRAGTLRLIPVLLRPSDWSNMSLLSELAPLPSDGRPLTLWENTDAAWLNVVQGVRQLLSSPPHMSVPRGAQPMRSDASLHIRAWVEPAGRPLQRTRDISVIAQDLRGDTFVLGDRLRIGFQADRRCYVLLVNHGTSGLVNAFYPPEPTTPVFCQGDLCHYFPHPSDGFDFILQGMPGCERIRVLASPAPVQLSRDELSLILCGALPPGWAEAACEFKVQGAPRAAP